MNDDYQKMSELLDKWLSDSEKGIKLAFIEKEILLEKVRKLYVQLSGCATEEYEAPKPETAPVAPEPAPQKQYSPAKTMEEDVELFFDTEHESYKAVEQELEHIAKEINEAQEQPAPKPEPAKKAKPEPDIFAQIEEKETPEKTEDAPLTDNAEELFIEPDFEITAQSEEAAVAEEEPVIEVKEPEMEEVHEEEMEEDLHEEDDILQFIPPKSTQPTKPEPTPQKPEPQKPEPQPVEEQPVPQQVVKEIEPKKDSPIQKPPQRSLNDLFNERHEDHSISSQYQRAKVGDLTKAISINDKFIYIKELFHNRGEDFSAAIRQLNECKNMEEAFDCLETLKQKFFWDSKSDAYLSFCDLLRRKYS